MCTSRPPPLPCRSCSCPLFSGVSSGHASFSSPSRDGAGNRKSSPGDGDASPVACSIPVRSPSEGTCRPPRSPTPRRRKAASHLLHERRGLPPQTQHQKLDPLGGGGPPQRRLADHPTGRLTHPCGQPCHELHHPRREAVPGQTQDHVERKKPLPPPRGIR